MSCSDMQWKIHDLFRDVFLPYSINSYSCSSINADPSNAEWLENHYEDFPKAKTHNEDFPKAKQDPLRGFLQGQDPRQAPVRGLLRRRGCACGCGRAGAAAAAAAAAASAPARVADAGAVNKPVYAWPGVSCCCNNLKWAAFKRAAKAPHSGGPAGRRVQPRQGPKTLMNMSCSAIYHDHRCICTVFSLKKAEENIGYT